MIPIKIQKKLVINLKKLEKFRNFNLKKKILDDNPNNYNEKLQYDFEVLNKIRSDSKLSEDEIITEQYFLKIKIFEYITMIYSIISK